MHSRWSSAGCCCATQSACTKAASYATAVVLAAFARVELGRSQILLRTWRDSSPVTVKQIEQKCGEHVAKQRAGMLSITLTANRDSGLGKILAGRSTNAPQSQEWKGGEATLKQIDEHKKKHTPDERHNKRMQALYVEPKSDSEWNRPADISAETAHRFLQDAVNDYSGRYHNGYIGLKGLDDDPYNALEQLTDRPQLLPPKWPQWPG